MTDEEKKITENMTKSINESMICLTKIMSEEDAYCVWANAMSNCLSAGIIRFGLEENGFLDALKESTKRCVQFHTQQMKNKLH